MARRSGVTHTIQKDIEELKMYHMTNSFSFIPLHSLPLPMLQGPHVRVVPRVTTGQRGVPMGDIALPASVMDTQTPVTPTLGYVW